VPAETHDVGDRPDVAEIRAVVVARAAELLDRSGGPVTAGTPLRDVDADDLAILDLVEALEHDLGERTVGFHLDDDDLEDVATVGDLVDVVVARLHTGGDGE
jgi:acyl carrier protein